MEETLLEKLGGESAIAKIVEDFYKRVSEDPRIKNRYNDLNLEEAKQKDASLLLALVRKETAPSEVGIISSRGGPLITKHEFNLVVAIYEEIAKEHGLTSSSASNFADVLNSIRDQIENH